MKNTITLTTKSYLTSRLMPILLATAILSLGAGSPSWAGNGNRDNPRILPPDSHPYGKTYSQWSAAWWQWVFSIPAPNNPLLDQTGQNAGANQSGNVWFLAGNMGGTSERTVTVPSGKAIFFPILNTAYFGYPCDDRNLPGCEADQALEQANDIATMLSFITPSMDGATLACEIDRIPVRHLSRYRPESSAWYTLTAVDNNIFGYLPGPYHPCVDTGYYLMLAPLSAGRHTIHFTGANSDGSFSLDVTYRLTVLREHHDAGKDDQRGDGK
jgi:hypothetical protein